MLDALRFYTSFPHWHSYNAKDRTTRNAINSLRSAGYLETNEFNQARATLKGKLALNRYNKQRA